MTAGCSESDEWVGPEMLSLGNTSTIFFLPSKPLCEERAFSSLTSFLCHGLLSILGSDWFDFKIILQSVNISSEFGLSV
jgi:ABC-type uncharacterized transport system permease subunit